MQYSENLSFFKFQSDSINTILMLILPMHLLDFKFQSDSINTLFAFVAGATAYQL